MLNFQGLSYITEIIWTQLISRYYDDLIGRYDIKKISKLVAQKYHWPILQTDIETYMKGCDVLASIAIKNKSYGDLQWLPVVMHC